MLALSFARSTAPMAFALRFSVLPLIDSIMQLAFHRGVEPDADESVELPSAHAFEIQRSAMNLQRFTLTKYFERELQRTHRCRPRMRKTPDS